MLYASESSGLSITKDCNNNHLEETLKSSAETDELFLNKIQNALDRFKAKQEKNNLSRQAKESLLNGHCNSESTVFKTETNQKENMPSSGLNIKTKTVVFEEEDQKIIINLISINGKTYVHWSQLCPLFNLSSYILKFYLVNLKKTNQSDSPSNPPKCLSILKTFKFDDESDYLFYLLEDTFNIDLKSIDETEELYLVSYNSLMDIADVFLHPEAAKQMKHFLVNNKLKNQSKTKCILKENKSIQMVAKAESSSDISDSIIKADKKPPLANTELNTKVITDEIERLKVNCLYLKAKIEKCPGDSEKMALLLEKYDEKEEKCKFFQSILS